MFDVLERHERELEEVARPAGWIEHPEPRQPLEEGQEDRPRLGFGVGGGGLGLYLTGARERRLNPRLRLGPFSQKRPDDHRLDDLHDRVAIGVLDAKLAPLVRVKAALEERAEDRAVHL